MNNQIRILDKYLEIMHLITGYEALHTLLLRFIKKYQILLEAHFLFFTLNTFISFFYVRFLFWHTNVVCWRMICMLAIYNLKLPTIKKLHRIFPIGLLAIPFLLHVMLW